MKRFLANSLLLIVLMGTTLSASDEYKYGVDFSAGTFAFDNKDTSGAVGIDVDWQKRIISDLYIGVGINAEIFNSENPNKINSSDMGIILDVYPTISYYITKQFSLNAMYGYSFGELGSETFDGTTYGCGAEYKLNEKWTIGAGYKKSELEFTSTTQKIDATRYNATISYKF